MMHKAALARLKEDIAALKRTSPSARLVVYSVLDEDCHRDTYISGVGSGPIGTIRVPEEFEFVRDWLKFVDQGGL